MLKKTIHESTRTSTNQPLSNLRVSVSPCLRVSVSPCLSVSASPPLAVRVGIEPTSIPFQGIANPSQLSDRRHWRLPIGDCRLESPNDRELHSNRQLATGNRQLPERLLEEPAPLLNVHLLNHVTIIVHVHEEVQLDQRCKLSWLALDVSHNLAMRGLSVATLGDRQRKASPYLAINVSWG